MKERLNVWFVDCEEEDLSTRTGGEFYLGKCMKEIEHEGISTCAGADNADQKIKMVFESS